MRVRPVADWAGDRPLRSPKRRIQSMPDFSAERVSTAVREGPVKYAAMAMISPSHQDHAEASL